MKEQFIAGCKTFFFIVIVIATVVLLITSTVAIVIAIQEAIKKNTVKAWIVGIAISLGFIFVLVCVGLGYAVVLLS